MKIKISLGVLLISGMLFQSCKKADMGVTTYQTVDVYLDINKPYQYDFGSDNPDLLITKQAQSSWISQLDLDNNANAFKYMPKANFEGSDEVEITLFKDQDDDKAGLFSNSKNQSKDEEVDHDEDDDRVVYTFKITVKKNTISTAVVTPGQK